MAQQVEVQLELGAGRRQRQHRVVELARTDAFGRSSPSRVPTRATWVSTGTSRRPKLNSSTQAAVLRPTPGSAQSAARLRSIGGVAHPVEAQRLADRAQDRLDAHRLDLRDAARADRLLDLLVRRVADRLPRTRPAVAEALAQPQEGGVAVAVVGALREHRQDQLVERAAVRRRRRDPVELAQPRRARGARARASGGRKGTRLTPLSSRLAMADVERHIEEIDGVPVSWRSAPGEGTPTVYVHGVPEQLADVDAVSDARPAASRSTCPASATRSRPVTFPYSIAGYDGYIERFLDWLGLDARRRSSCHDFGAAALAFAQRAPERVERARL